MTSESINLLPEKLKHGFMRRIISALSTGYVLCYFSEYMFWSTLDRYMGVQGVQDFIFVWLIYSAMAYMVLWISSHFRANDFYSWFLVGAIYGWLGEGAVVYTMYLMFPLQISWTGLAWHSLISIVCGWFLFRKAVVAGNFKQAAKISIFLGLFFGFWAPTWWSEPPNRVIPIENYAIFVVLFTILVIFGYIIYEKCAPSKFEPSKIEKVFFVGIFCFFFLFGTIPAVGLYAITLPILLFVVLRTLKKKAQNRSNSITVTNSLSKNINTNLKGYLLLLLLPLVAIGVYGLFFVSGLIFQTSIVVYLITLPLGFIFLILAIYRAYRPKIS